jgi:hypothetical protein
MTRKFPIKGLAPPLCLTALVLTGCGAHLDAASAPSETTAAAAPAAATPAGSALPRIHLPVKMGETVEGLVDVNGHDIYARCSGTGSPTVVYFTGWAPDPSKLGVNAIRAIETVDGGKLAIDLTTVSQPWPPQILHQAFDAVSGWQLSGTGPDYESTHRDPLVRLLLSMHGVDP